MNNKPKEILISGLQGSGKTNLIQTILAKGQQEGKNLAAFKPFDTGLLMKNAQEINPDGLNFSFQMQGEPLSTLITPYIAHEEYPLEMAFRRDGIKIDYKHVSSRKDILREHYQQTWVELPAGNLTPLSEDKTTLEWIIESKNPVLHVVSTDKNRFSWELLELQNLVQAGIEVYWIINNTIPPMDQDYIFYLWEALERISGLQAEGMFPYIQEINTEKQIAALEKHLPSISEKLIY